MLALSQWSGSAGLAQMSGTLGGGPLWERVLSCTPAGAEHGTQCPLREHCCIAVTQSRKIKDYFRFPSDVSASTSPLLGTRGSKPKAVPLPTRESKP